MAYFCSNCKVFTEMIRDINKPLEVRCVCGYTVVEVFRGANIYLPEPPKEK
jgi:DNA-directed RNA polymerase subunit RPC12/RpoP